MQILFNVPNIQFCGAAFAQELVGDFLVPNEPVDVFSAV
jgi:hypothetical protein